MRRHLIGILSIILLIGAALLQFSPCEGQGARMLLATCWRLGPVLAVLWLAYPEVERMPPWIWFLVPGIIAVLVWKPRLLFIAVPVLLLIGVLRPRTAKKSAR